MTHQRSTGARDARGNEASCATVWPLPAVTYRPGTDAALRPADDDPLYAIAALAPAVTDADAWQANAAYLHGLHLYANGFFWEAHEVWEPVWAHARPNSRERALLQGLIQLANACLKVASGRPAAAERLAVLAAAHFAEASAGAPRVMGLETSACLDAVRRFSADVRASRPVLLLHYNS